MTPENRNSSMISWCGLSRIIVCCCWKREILFFHLPPTFWPCIPVSRAVSLRSVEGLHGPHVKSSACAWTPWLLNTVQHMLSWVPLLPFCTVPELPPAATKGLQEITIQVLAPSQAGMLCGWSWSKPRRNVVGEGEAEHQDFLLPL